MPVQIDVAELAGLVIEGILYGVFLALFVATMQVLTRKRRHSRPNIPSIVSAVVMFILATAQISVDTTNIFLSFITLDRTHSVEFLLDGTKPILAARAGIYFTMMLVGDVILIYRTFVIWERNFWVILIPVCCTIGAGVAEYHTIWVFRHNSDPNIHEETKWGYAIFASSLAANFIATSLLAYRIWSHEARINSVLPKGLGMARLDNMTIVRIILESGMINVAYLIAYLVILRTGGQGLEILAYMTTPIIGITFATVILRMAMAAQREEITVSTTIHSPNSRLEFPMRSVGIAMDSDSMAMDKTLSL
ncbi:hypothetical protein BD410DRAFT_807367 [Rickenella mellea]|uniref:Uncharacterized protein n=1 Tax=Rickenella mellea TaxID=50990 RepID=A0A4Y7PQX9_9AGAM|nr:hypothetical protein BD410DRAFT_807367 [Rickenella mellea]